MLRKEAFLLMSVLLFSALNSQAMAVPAAPVQLPEIPDAELSPDYKEGGMVLGEVLDVTQTQEAGENASRTVRLKATEVIGGGMQPGEVLVVIPGKNVMAQADANQAVSADLKPGTRVLAVLHEAQATGRIYSAQVLLPFTAVDKQYFETQGQIAIWLRMRDKKGLAYVIEGMDFSRKSKRVQLFALKQLDQYGTPYPTIAKIIPVFLNAQYDEEVRTEAYSLIYKWLPEALGDSAARAVDALIKGLQDPSLRIRVRALQLLPETAAHEDVEQGEFIVNPRIIAAIGEAAKKEKNPGVRKLALDAQEHIRAVIRKIKKKVAVPSAE